MTVNPVAVSHDVLCRIADAIDEIGSNDELQRTKKQIERLTGLSHPTVARAFAQDLRKETSFAINARFAALNPVGKGLSPTQQAERKEKRDLEAYRRRVAELEAERDIQLQALYAYYLSSRPSSPGEPLIPINRKRRAMED